MVKDRHFQYMFFLRNSTSSLTLTHPWDQDSVSAELNALTAVGALMTLINYTLSNARRFYSSKLGEPLGSERAKEKQKYICWLITQHISVNIICTMCAFFGYPGVLCYQTIGISMIMSMMGIVLQIFVRCVVNCIKRTFKLKLKVKMILDSHFMAFSFRKRST